MDETRRLYISERTRAALELKRAQGVRLGRPRSLAPETRARILELSRQGESFNSIARTLAREGTPTAQGGRWRADTVSKIVKGADLGN